MLLPAAPRGYNRRRLATDPRQIGKVMAMPHASRELMQLLIDWSNGDQAALDKLMPLVYNDLRQIAKRYVSRQNPGHTLQTTELINEAFLKLRYFGGLSVEETAEVLKVSAITVMRDWSMAKAWLHRELSKTL